MHAQNCLFRALECSNRAHSDLDKLMEALFFIRAGGLALKSSLAARRARRHQLRHPHRPEVWDARRLGGHSSPLLLLQDLLVPHRNQHCRWRGRRRRGSLVDLISFADAPPTGLVRTKPKCQPPSPRCSYSSSPAFWKNRWKIRLRSRSARGMSLRKVSYEAFGSSVFREIRKKRSH